MYVTQSTEKNMVIVLGADDEPHFCKLVRCLIITSEMVYFVCQNLQVKYYDSHLHAYVVEQGEGLHAVDHRCLNYLGCSVFVECLTQLVNMLPLQSLLCCVEAAL